jgi:hypothetical protein
MPMRCLWCAVATSALAVAVSGLAGCSEGAKPTPAGVPAQVPGDVPRAPAAQGIPKPGKATPGASASPSAPAAAAPAAVAAPAAAAVAPAVKGPSVKGPPKGKVPTKFQGRSPSPAEPL